MVIIALLFLTRAFELMPLNALAAIVIAGVSGLLDFHSFWRYLQVRQALSVCNRNSRTSLVIAHPYAAPGPALSAIPQGSTAQNQHDTRFNALP